MIHRLALLLGGAGAAGVLALAFAMGGTASPLAKAADAFVPVANDLSTPQSAATTEESTTDVQNVYVLPTPHAPKAHKGGAANDPQPTDKPRQPRDDKGDNQAGDDSGSGDQAENGSDDQSGGGDHQGGGSGGDGAEQGDD